MEQIATIRQHLRRRSKIALLFLLGGMGLTLVLVWVARFAPWLQALAPITFMAAVIGGTVPCTFQRCPGCGRWFDRGEYAGFTWPFAREPIACSRCGLSYDTEWRKYKRTEADPQG